MKKIHRFICPVDRQDKRLFVRDPAILHQIASVLRLHAFEWVAFCDGAGKEFLVCLEEVSKSEVYGTIEQEQLHAYDVPCRVTLYAAVLKREHFEWIVQKTTEIGVAKIVPLLTRRTIKQGIKHERLRIIAREAAEQSRRNFIPEITEPYTFDQVWREARHDRLLFCDQSGEMLRTDQIQYSDIGVLIGPEGGWEEEEIRQAHEQACLFMRLSTCTLRAETAALLGVHEILR